MRLVPAVALVLLSMSLTGCQQTPNATTQTSPQVFYSPATNLEAMDTRLIASATHTIDVCAYALTDRAVIQALEQAAGRGVRVRIYVDRGQTEGELARESKSKSRTRHNEDEDTADSDNNPTELATLSSLASAPNIELRVKHSKTLMHLKSYVVDNKTLRSGSANFSPTGEKRQDNDLILTSDSAAVSNFENNFSALWSRPDNEPLPIR